MDNAVISYYFDAPDMAAMGFEVHVNRPSALKKGNAPWTRLQHQQCENCPLQPDVFTHCPAAVDLESVFDALGTVLQEAEVTTIVGFEDGREIHQTGEPSTAVAALLGLVMGSCACPILGRMKGLALTHAPFVSPNESLFRFVGAYLIGQFVEQRNGETADWSMDGLKEFLQQVETVNRGFLKRLEVGGRHDDTLNSIRLLMAQAMSVQGVLDDWNSEMDQYGIMAIDAP